MKVLGSKRIWTTAYYAISNELVECFPRQLKAALRVQPEVTNWAVHLPMVLFGFCTTLKEDLHCTVAELVYGLTLRLPAEFFDSSSSKDPDPLSYVGKLKATMQQLRATPPHRHSRHKAYVSKDLAHCTHVFVRHDATQTPLQPPYDGPYKVMERGDKTFTITVNGQQKVVSLDRLKPAHVEDSSIEDTKPTDDSNWLDSPPIITSPTPATKITRSGRRVHFPARFGF